MSNCCGVRHRHYAEHVVVDEDSSGEIGKSANLGQFTVGDSSSGRR